MKKLRKHFMSSFHRHHAPSLSALSENHTLEVTDRDSNRSRTCTHLDNLCNIPTTVQPSSTAPVLYTQNGHSRPADILVTLSGESHTETQFALSLECSNGSSASHRVVNIPVFPSDVPEPPARTQVRYRRRVETNGSDDKASKRLSLPVRMMTGEGSPCSSSEGRSPILNDLQSLSRRDRRSSLADFGFGKSSSYRKLEKLGQGTYATVYRGKSLLTDSLVALKEIRLEHEEGAPCTAIREVSLLRDLKHANIVTLHDIIHTEKSLTLVFEYLDKDLKQCMDECQGFLHESNVRLFMYQLVRGLSYCHQRRYLHRDLKPQNLLINDKGELKLADFGLARAKSVPIKTYSNEVCTLWYRPPDVLLGNTEYSTHIDLWGVGAIFFEMLTARPLFPGSTVEEQLQLIFKVLGTPTEETWPGCTGNPQFTAYNFPEWPQADIRALAPRFNLPGVDLLLSFLRFEAKARMSAFDAKFHPYFMKFLPAILNDLPDTSSIFEVPGLSLSPNPTQNGASFTEGERLSRS